MDVFSYFKRKGIDTVDQTFYSRIEVWRSWYKSNVHKFHRYKVYRGNGSCVKCQRLSLGMAKRVCEDMANLLLNERVQVTVDDKRTQDYVEKVLADNFFYELGNEYQEWKAALGTVAYVVYVSGAQVDADGRLFGGNVKINYVEAGNIFPTTWENRRVTECVFTFVKTYKRKSYVLFQYHKLEEAPGTNGKRQYVIENAVVENESGNGKELTPEQWNEIPVFAGLAPRLQTGSDEPQFVIDRLNIVNNADEDGTNPMGVALFANAIDTLRKLDLEYDSYANEFSLGRKRLFVAPEFLTTDDGQPVFDPEDTVFYELPEDFFKNTNEAIHEVNMDLRVEQHSKAIKDDLNILSSKCGFGTERYNFEKGQVKTATEVISENSDMYRNLRKHEQTLERALVQLVHMIVRAGVSTGVAGLKEECEVTVMFDDSIIQDKEKMMQTDFQMMSAGILRPEEFRAKWLGESLEDARENLPVQNVVME